MGLIRRPPLAVGIAVAAAGVALTTLLLYALDDVAPVLSLGVVYLFAVLLVATVWGAWLGIATAIASAAAFNFFHIPPNESFAISGSQNLAAFAAFVVAALIAVVVAYLTDRLRRGEELRLREAQARARVLTAADDERRRVVRDLHDGAQQRLIHAVITLKLALGTLREGDAAGAETLVSEALSHAEQATVEVRELAHGILPSVLTHGGLRAGVDALASRMPVPVQVAIPADRLPAPIEATAYFVVAEALTNVANHAGAASASIAARSEDGTLLVEVRDDGVGGARRDGSGLQGLRDRLAALDGRLRIESPTDGGTLVTATIPIPASATER